MPKKASTGPAQQTTRAAALTSIPTVLLFQPVLDDPAGYIAGGGKDNQIYLGAFLEFLLIIANVGTVVVLSPIARRQNEAILFFASVLPQFVTPGSVAMSARCWCSGCSTWSSASSPGR